MTDPLDKPGKSHGRIAISASARPRELMTDSDRVFPGEGDFQLAPIVATLKRIGYDGGVSLEMMNPAVWRAKPSQVAELGMTALKRTLGESE